MKTNRTLAIYIPLKQNGVFRQYEKSYLKIRKNVSIPFEQGDVFRQTVATEDKQNDFLSQSLSIRAMFFDTEIKIEPYPKGGSQSLSSRAMSFDQQSVNNQSCSSTCLNPFRSGQCLSTVATGISSSVDRSQSLSSRAMSFDASIIEQEEDELLSQSLSNRAMSFDSSLQFQMVHLLRLNPFRSGRCLSTYVC